MSTDSLTDPRATRFVLDGQVVRVAGLPATTTVLEYLRDFAGRTGTKEGCAEGDCGACTVVVGELRADGRSIDYRAINSCIRFLPTIDGKELLTVESLQGPDGSLHPVQRAMVDCHGSQCGFCTPGFVMSLFALYLENETPQREDVLSALSGNLCRCTGYRPIIEAGCRMSEYRQPERWSRAQAQSGKQIERLRALRRSADSALRFPGFHAPATIDELASALQAAPDSLVLAGGTDVGLWTTKHLRDLPPLVYVGAIPELQQIETSAAGLRIGAGVSLSNAWKALVHQHPGLAEQAQRFGSPPVRNSGTLCGNVANGSPIGDSMPALIALGTQVNLRQGKSHRQLPLEQLYLGYQKKDLRPGEFVESVFVPRAAPGTLFASYKLAKRIDQDISAVCGAFTVELSDGRVAAVRLAFGGMAAVPARAANAEKALLGKAWSQDPIDAAIAALPSDFKPLTDARATQAYRLTGAAGMLKRFYLQHNPDAPPLRVAEFA